MLWYSTNNSWKGCRRFHHLLINAMTEQHFNVRNKIKFKSLSFIVHLSACYLTVADLPCTKSLSWVCCGCRGHAWVAPGSSCPSSCLSVRRAAAGKWQDCRAEEPTLDTRSAGTRCLRNKRYREAKTVRHKPFPAVKNVVVHNQESQQVREPNEATAASCETIHTCTFLGVTDLNANWFRLTRVWISD